MIVGQIGLGRWGKVILKNLTEFSIITKVYVFDSLKTNIPNNLSGKIIVCNTKEELLQNQEVKAVFISTPADTHYELAIECLQANKDIFVEKPLTCNSQQIDDIEKASAKHSKVIMTNHTLLFDTRIQTIKKYISKHNVSPSFFDFIRSNISGNSDVNVIWDLAPHDIALALFMLQSKVKSVYCSSNSKKDTAFFILNFNDNIVAKFQLSWRYPFKRRELIIGHDKGSIFFSEKEREFTLIMLDTNNSQTIVDPSIEGMSNSNPLKNSIALFLSKVGSNDLAFSREQAAFAKSVIRIIEALHDSMDTNKVVDI